MQRLGRNHGAYHGESIAIGEVMRDILSTAREHGWSVEEFGSQGEFGLAALHRQPHKKSVSLPPLRIYVSTGIHGDEPAGPLAVRRLVQENQWVDPAEFVVIPCLNPVGFAANRRTNPQGVDLNRDYLHPQSEEVQAHIGWLGKQPSFDLCLCLHEDWEAHGFYVYELNPEGRPSLAEAIIAGVERVCPIDRSEMIEGREARHGIIRPNLDPRTRPQWPESFWLLMNKTRQSYTLEAPSDFSLATRVNALVAGARAALDEWVRTRALDR